MKKRSVVEILVTAVVVALALGVLAGAYFVTVGVSARPQPTALERVTANTVRGIAIRTRVRGLTNPVQASATVIKEGRGHFADQCAVCHGNDGSGNTEMGRGLYPRAPDMRLAATQNLSDAELFYIIENGVRLTGMPGWSTGTKEGETLSWHLVHFIRQLPHLTSDDIEQMESLNPKSPEEIRQEIEAEQFLNGTDSPAPSSSESHEHGDHHE